MKIFKLAKFESVSNPHSANAFNENLQDGKIRIGFPDFKDQMIRQPLL
jgi:hypothetical protein